MDNQTKKTGISCNLRDYTKPNDGDFAKTRHLYGNSTETFKLSHRWIVAFMKRNKLVLRRHTKISQKLPEQTQELLESFRQYIIHLKSQKLFELGNIFNMDETPVWFDMAGNFTVNPKGEKTVHIRAMGNEKNRFTVVLTCAAGRDVKHCTQFTNAVFNIIDGTRLYRTFREIPY